MGKRIIVIFFALLCFSCGNEPVNKKAPGYDFRKTRWGMSIEEVKASEKSTFLKQSDLRIKDSIPFSASIKPDMSLEYKGNLYDLDCLIHYGFIGNKLVNAHYSITTPYSLFVYYELKELIAIKYKAIEKEKISFDKEGHDTYKMCRALFENEKTALTLTSIYPDDDNLKSPAIGKSHVSVDYESKAFKRLIEKKKEKALEDL